MQGLSALKDLGILEGAAHPQTARGSVKALRKQRAP